MKHLLLLAFSYIVLLFFSLCHSSDSINEVIDTNVAVDVTNELVVKDTVNNPINGYSIIASLLTLLAFAFVIGLKPLGNSSASNKS